MKKAGKLALLATLLFILFSASVQAEEAEIIDILPITDTVDSNPIDDYFNDNYEPIEPITTRVEAVENEPERNSNLFIWVIVAGVVLILGAIVRFISLKKKN